MEYNIDPDQDDECADGCCSCGVQPKPIELAKVGDLIRVCTKEGKCWLVDVVGRTENVINMQNEDVRLVFHLDTKSLYNIYREGDYTGWIEMFKRGQLSEDIVEFLNYKDDPHVIDLLRLIALHVNHWSKEELELLTTTIRRDIFKLRQLKRLHQDDGHCSIDC